MSIAHRNAIRINYNHGFNEFLTPCIHTRPAPQANGMEMGGIWGMRHEARDRDRQTAAHESLEHPLSPAKLPGEQPLTINTNGQNDCQCDWQVFGWQCGITIFNKPKNYATWITIGPMHFHLCSSRRRSCCRNESRPIKAKWLRGKYLCSCYSMKALEGHAVRKEW